ncbi:MAG: hypothetical protein WAK27_10490 [Candidatus Sulfotelmatobacter sp.]
MNSVVIYLIWILVEGKWLLGCCRARRYIASANHTGTSAAGNKAECGTERHQN